MSRQTLKCTVAGRVQGVFYRASAAELARERGVSGWIRNLADGRVELVVSGSAGAVETLVEWLWHGPPKARVVSVTLEEWLEEPAEGFEIRA